MSTDQPSKPEKPISDKKLQANRRNAAQSTGPKTPEGKAQSARNAIKHGLLARHILFIEPDRIETPEEFDALLKGLIADYRPVGLMERLLVERIAATVWRLRRAYRYEANAVYEARHPEPSLMPSMRVLCGDRFPLPPPVLPYAKELQKLLQYETFIDRELQQTVTQLERLQRARREAAACVAPAAPGCASQADAPTPPAPNEPTAKPLSRHRKPRFRPLDTQPSSPNEPTVDPVSPPPAPDAIVVSPSEVPDALPRSPVLRRRTRKTRPVAPRPPRGRSRPRSRRHRRPDDET